MTPLELGLFYTVILVLLVLAGMRVGFAAGLIGLLGLITYQTTNLGFERGVIVALKLAGTIPHSKTASYALSLIPLFILIGYLAYHAGLTEALFEAAKRWAGRLPGGLAVATIMAAAGFAAVSGASVATSAVFARVAIPEMLRLNYDKRFAAGVVAAGGTLAALIPPSTILVIYAILVEQSVGKLLLAGFIPGFFSALIYMAMIVGMAWKWPQLGPPTRRYSLSEKLKTIPMASPILIVVGVIISCLYFGWGTPTEAGALGSFVILVMALARGMKAAQLRDALMATARLTVMIFTIIWGVLIYVRFLGYAGLPHAFAEWIAALDQPRIVILLAILAGYAILGMFMDAIGMLILTVPVVYPAIIGLGYDPIWFGIIVVKMAELCLITPPIGLNCFVVAAVRPDIPVQDVYRGAAPFFVADLLTVGMLIAFPEIVLWLPRLLSH